MAIQQAAPTVVLMHGAFADGSSWNGVIERLRAKRVLSSPLRTRFAGSRSTRPTSRVCSTTSRGR
jgi:hypothetical protein